MTPLLIAIAVAVTVTVGAVVWRLRAASSRPSSRQAASGAGPKPESQGGRDKSAVDRSKMVIHGLLHELSDNIESFVSENSRYDGALSAHKASISKAMTLAGIRELERVLLDEVDAMRGSNATYRKQLALANATVKVQQEQLERLQTDAEKDFLTELPNRRAFQKRMAEFHDRFSRYGNTFSIVVMDVDHFKMVNDDHGHIAGDRVLRAIAAMLQDQKRSTDFLARYGGEEFVLLLPETSAAQAHPLAEKTCAKIQRAKFRYEDATIELTMSAGVGEVRADEEPTAFFARVDAALYQAKANGRNRVESAE